MPAVPPPAATPARLDSPAKTAWPYLSAPLGIYITVMLPICALEAFLIATHSPMWMKLSAALVLLFSIVAWIRGYRRRLIVTETGVTFIRLGSRIEMPWPRIRRVGRYVPGGGVGGPQYVYVARVDRAPAGKWEITHDIVQVQDRPGLLESLARFAPRGTVDHSGSPVDVS
jgi:hypothetical protein